MLIGLGYKLFNHTWNKTEINLIKINLITETNDVCNKRQ